MSTNIQVAIRIRPLIADEREKRLPVQWGTQNNIIYQIDDVGQTYGELYSFDHIFETEKTNREIYNDIVKDFVVASLDGLNSTIFAYGQTSSGKTYTMLGDKKDTGVMSLAIENIFEIVEKSTHRKFLIRVSYIEIYNEKINDLLDPTNKDVKIREFFPATIGLQNIKEEIVSTREQMYDCLKKGTSNRRIGVTKANDRSSRSHTIFKIMIESTKVSDIDSSSGSVQVSNLNLVDLAGSERVAQTKATGVRLKEGGHINKSLSALGLVIRQLSDGQEFVNFRDSKLTRLLQDSLGGNSKTLIIATITLASIEDTCSTLAFAQRAKAVKNKPRVNEILTDADMSKRYASLNAQLQKKLEEQLLINQKLQLTQEENTREMTRLHQQMEMLEDFQHGRSYINVEAIPKRRHTIAYTSKKPLFTNEFKISDQDLRNSSEDLQLKDYSILTNTLETIIEEESASVSKVSTPEMHLRTRLSALEQEYNELVTYTRDEDNILSETVKKNEELEELLKSQQNLKDQFKLKEDELCNKIAELEQQLLTQEKNEKENEDALNIADIKDQLMYLQNILKEDDSMFLNDSEKTWQNSVLEIIEKFNTKVKTSKEIIESEILKQINNFDQGTQEQIIIPNELTGFNKLLHELSLFDSDIPVDLINQMKREGIEDLKILIKVYESFLKKNELIGRCSEKIKVLEEQIEGKNEIYHNEVNDLKTRSAEMSLEIIDKNKIISELENNSVLLKQEIDNFKTESSNLCLEKEKLADEIERISIGNELYCKEVNDLKTRAAEMSLEVIEKSKIISEFEDNSLLLKQEINNLKTESSNFCVEKEKLAREIERVTISNELYCKEVNDLKTRAAEMSLEAIEKSKVISELEDNSVLLKQEIDNLKTESSNLYVEKEQLAKEIERISVSSEMYCKEINDLKNTTNNLTQEIVKKNDLLTEAQKNFEIVTQEKEILQQEIINIASEKDKTISEISKIVLTLQQEIELKEKSVNMSSENEQLPHDIKISTEKGNLQGTLNNCIERDNSVWHIENNASVLRQELENVKHKSVNLSLVNQRLKCEMDKIQKEAERFKQEMTNTCTQKDKTICDLKNNTAVLKDEIENLKQKSNSFSLENGRLRTEIGRLTKEFENFKAEMVNNCTAKDKTISDIKNTALVLKQEIENLKQQSINLSLEKQNLQCKIETLTQENEKIIQNIMNKCVEKDKAISEINNTLAVKEEIENLKQKCITMSADNERLQCEIETLIEEKEKIREEMINKCIEKDKIIFEIKNNPLVTEELDSLKQKSVNMTLEKHDLQCKIETLTQEKEKIMQDMINKCIEKDKTISEMKDNTLAVKEEIESLKQKYINMSKDNEHLQCEIERLTQEKEKIGQEITDRCINNTLLKQEIEHLKQKCVSMSIENENFQCEMERLNNAVEYCKRNNKWTEQRLKSSESRVERQINESKVLVTESDKLKCDISQYKFKLADSSRKQEEYEQQNVQLLAQVQDLQNKVSQLIYCGETDKNLENIVKDKETTVNELEHKKTKYESIICNMIELFINEQKTILMIRHSQDQRDYFKNVIKDLKSHNTVLKQQLHLLQNRKDCDFKLINEILIRSNTSLKEYFSLEKSFLKSHINELDSNNKAYLQEIMALKDLQHESNSTKCLHCESMKLELAKLKEEMNLQNENLNCLKDKNELLGKENRDTKNQFVKLQKRIYNEQDKKAELQYSDLLKFYKENMQMQEQEIKNLQKLMSQKSAMKGKHCAEVQCNILDGEYNTMKNKKEAEVQCTIITVEKYNLMKAVCFSRKQEIRSLKQTIDSLSKGLNNS